MERRLIKEYATLAQRLPDQMTVDNYAKLIEMANYPDAIRGFGHIEHANAITALKRRDQLLSEKDSIPKNVTQAGEPWLNNRNTRLEISAMKQEDNHALSDQVLLRSRRIDGPPGDTVDGLHATAYRIADIIRIIDDIAFQINILALNARWRPREPAGRVRGLPLSLQKYVYSLSALRR